MKIGFDLDGVLANFSKSFRRVFKDYLGIEIPNGFYDKNGYALSWYISEKYPHITKEIEIECLTKIIPGIPYFWERLESLITDEERSLIRKAYIDHELFFISNREANPTILETRVQCFNWLNDNIFYHSLNRANIIITQHKVDFCKLIGIDVMIEDNFKNWKELNTNGIMCYLLRRPYNDLYRPLDKHYFATVGSVKEYFKKIGA